MNAFKRIISLSVIICLCVASLALVSCHGRGPAKEEFKIDEEFNCDEKVEITFWAKNDSNNIQKGIYNKAAEDFCKLYPNITVNIKFYTDYGTIYNDVITNIQTDTTPNVCISYPDHIATYMTGENIMVAMDDLMRDSRYGFGGSELKFDGVTKEEIIPQFLGEGQIAGKQYAMPFMRSTEACYVNKTYVEALGYTIPETLTWDFIWEVSEAAMQKNADGTFKVNGQKTMIPFIYKSTDNMMIQMLAQKGAPYSTSNAEIKLFNDTTKERLTPQATQRSSSLTIRPRSFSMRSPSTRSPVHSLPSRSRATPVIISMRDSVSLPLTPPRVRPGSARMLLLLISTRRISSILRLPL